MLQVLRWPEDLGLELLLPLLTRGILQSIIDTPHLPSQFPPLCLTLLSQHANFKGNLSLHGGHEEQEAHRLKPPALLLRGSDAEAPQLTPNKLILPFSEPLSTSLFHPLPPSLFKMETSGAVPSGSVSK